MIDLVLVTEVEARKALGSHTVRERLLVPPYPALGVGRLRVLRIRDAGEVTEMLCGYEGYERL